MALALASAPMSSFDLTLLYLLAAVIGVVACRSLKLPPMLGYLSAGVLIGPHAFALAQNTEGIQHLGEFGVVFLMFVIVISSVFFGRVYCGYACPQMIFSESSTTLKPGSAGSCR